MGCHASEDALERYSMGRCLNGELEELEDHILLCEVCQQRLERTDQYIAAMKSASREFEREELAAPARKHGGWMGQLMRPQQLAWASALCVVLLAVGIWGTARHPVGDEPQRVALLSYRGTDLPMPARATGDTPITLNIDVTELGRSPQYRVEIVRGDGAVLVQGKASATANGVSFLAGRLKTGHYWVRLYSGAGNLLREYALDVR